MTPIRDGPGSIPTLLPLSLFFTLVRGYIVSSSMSQWFRSVNFVPMASALSIYG